MKPTNIKVTKNVREVKPKNIKVTTTYTPRTNYDGQENVNKVFGWVKGGWDKFNSWETWYKGGGSR